MDTVNIVLMMALCTIIGFAIGNAWGRMAMKQAIVQLIEQISKGLKMEKPKAEEE